MKKRIGLTTTQMKEIDYLFIKYHSSPDRLNKELEKYKYPDGSLSLYIRWGLDTLNSKITPK